MKTALRRELEVTGWQALGFLLGLAGLALVALLWGLALEDDLGDVARRQHRDHRHIVAIERGHPLGGGALQSPSGGQQPSPPSGGHPGNPPSGQIPPLEPPGQAPPVSASANNPGLVESVGPTLGGTVSGVTGTVCSTTAQLQITCP